MAARGWFISGFTLPCFPLGLPDRFDRNVLIFYRRKNPESLRAGKIKTHSTVRTEDTMRPLQVPGVVLWNVLGNELAFRFDRDFFDR